MTENNKIYKKLYIFDFDDTLVFTPHPDEGKKIYFRETGEEWKHGGFWWNNPRSLKPPIVPNPAPITLLNQSVAREANNAIRERTAYVVVMTGRHEKLREDVSRILYDYGIEPDNLYLTPPDERTLSFKLRKIKDLISRFPNLEEVHIWDDKGPKKGRLLENQNENHIDSFRKLGDTITEIKESNGIEFKFKAHEVISPYVAALDAAHEKLRQEEKEKKERLQVNSLPKKV